VVRIQVHLNGAKTLESVSFALGAAGDVVELVSIKNGVRTQHINASNAQSFLFDQHPSGPQVDKTRWLFFTFRRTWTVPHRFYFVDTSGIEADTIELAIRPRTHKTIDRFFVLNWFGVHDTW